MKNFKQKIYLIFFIIVLFFSVVHFSYAYQINFITPESNVGRGDEFSMPIELMSDSGDGSVNAISGDIVFDDNMFTAVRVLSANSIVSFWIDTPHISGNAIVFSGIMPNGYQSVTNPETKNNFSGTIATIVFKAKDVGIGHIQFTDQHLYKNDGLGTEIPVKTSIASIKIIPSDVHLTLPVIDDISPLPFTPQIVNNKNLFGGKYAVIFSTTDKQSGINHYEVKEGNLEWTRAESPYMLLDQSLPYDVYVKAVDLNGNFVIGVAQTTHIRKSIISLIMVLLLLVFIAYLIHREYIFFHKRRLKKK